MPQRLLRPNIRQSKRWNRVDYFSQSFYIRLLSMVDDFGRYDATTRILRNEAFPDGDPDGNDVTCQQIASSLTALCQQDLIVLYKVDGTQYLQLQRWHERKRSAARYPGPNDSTLSARCQQSDSTLPAPPTSTTTPTTTGLSIKVSPLNALDELKKVLSVQYRRPADHPWTYAEETQLAEIARRPAALDELQIILTFFRRVPFVEKKFIPQIQSIAKLVAGWDEVLDRARVSRPAPIRPLPPPRLTGQRFTPSPELANKFREQFNQQVKQGS